jgi:hypothetical protein
MIKKRLFIFICAFLLIGTTACSAFQKVQNWIHPPQPGSTLFSDDFSDPSSGWTTWNGDGSAVDYNNGGLRFYINQLNFDYWSMPPGDYRDVHIEVMATKLTGPDDNHYGIICRYKNRDNFYSFIISSDGYFGIMKVKEGNYSLITGTQMQYSEIIRQSSVTNYLQADCIGENLVFSVNGQKVAVAQDKDFNEGAVGLIAGTYSSPSVDILFDNFAIYQP